MISDALREYFDDSPLESNSRYELSYRIVKKSKPIIGKSINLYIDVLAMLFSNEVNFKEMANKIDQNVQKYEQKIKSIISRWVITSSRGGIYLYEAIAINENLQYHNMINKIGIVNTDDGTISFGPGHVENYKHTQVMSFLINNRREMSEETWKHQFRKCMDSCLYIIGK